MIKIYLSTFIFGVLLFFNTANAQKNKKGSNVITTESITQNTYNIITNMGNITVLLYNETPKHRDNFIKLVNSKFYDSLLFHRVIDNFMIQAGDPNSRRSLPEDLLGDGDIGYTIPAEFSSKLIHKKGVLAAARESDEINPKKESSGCQFYIVKGQKFTLEELTNLEKTVGENKKQEMYTTWALDSANTLAMDSVKNMQTRGESVELETFIKKNVEPSIEIMYAKNPFKMSALQKETYTTIGGTPHLDGGYTVFGEIVNGFDIVEKICSLKKNEENRPIENVIILRINKQ